MKTRHLVFRDNIFPSLEKPTPPVVQCHVEIPWPVQEDPLPSRRHCCLSVSIHNPDRLPLSPSMFKDLPPSPTISSPLAPAVSPCPCPPPLSVPSSAPVSSRHSPGSTPSPRLASPSRSLSPAANNKPVTPPAPRRSTKTSAPPKRLGNFVNLVATTAADSIDTPKMWKQLPRSPNKTRWLKADNYEFNLLLGREIWKLVPRT